MTGKTPHLPMNANVPVEPMQEAPRLASVGPRDGRRARWIEENRQAFAAYDADVRANGVFSDGVRLF